MPLQPQGDPVALLQRRIRVALGQEPGDLLLTGAQVVNVFTDRVEPANVVVANGWVAGVGLYDWPAREQIDLTGRFILPGLIDAHMHLESTLLLPAELARLIVPHGTSATISDSHEVGNVLGIPGIDMVAPFGTSLHVAGSDSDALDKAVARFRDRPELTWSLSQPSLEDVFISLMMRSQDNFK